MVAMLIVYAGPLTSRDVSSGVDAAKLWSGLSDPGEPIVACSLKEACSLKAPQNFQPAGSESEVHLAC